jgi:hypothetical protein
MDFDGEVGAWLESIVGVCFGEELGCCLEEAGMDGDRADLVIRGFGGIDDEVHEDLLELGGVGECWGEVWLQSVFEGYFLTDGELEELHIFFYELADVEFPESEFGFAGVGEQLAAEVGSVFSGVVDFLEGGVGWAIGGEVEFGEADISDDGSEEVIEVVGDTAGEEAEAFEFLGFLELAVQFATGFFRLGAVGNFLEELGIGGSEFSGAESDEMFGAGFITLQGGKVEREKGGEDESSHEGCCGHVFSRADGPITGAAEEEVPRAAADADGLSDEGAGAEFGLSELGLAGLVLIVFNGGAEDRAS